MEGRQEDEPNDILSSGLCMVTLQMGLLPVALYNLVSERKVLANVSNIVMSLELHAIEGESPSSRNTKCVYVVFLS